MKMKKCYKCDVIVNTSLHKCPLCQNEISHEKVKTCVFPVIPTLYKRHNLLYQILTFISVFGVITCLLINIIVSKEIGWSWFVITGIICFWATIITAIKRRNHFMRFLFAEFNLIIIITILWDYITGWNMWSVDYVFPFTCISYIIVMFIMRIFFNYYIKDYIIYITVNCLMGIIPLILVFFKVLLVNWPSVLSGLTSIFMVALLAIFNRKSLTKELERRFHF
jgi:hypothetical protein